MLFDDEREFFEKLIAEQSVCKCHVSKQLVENTLEEIDSQFAWLGMSNTVVDIHCPTSEHRFVMSAVPGGDGLIKVAVVTNEFWWKSTVDELFRYCNELGTEFELAARKFHNATS